MSFIKVLAPEEADPKLKAAFEEIMEWRGGRLPPVLQCMSLNPDAMLAVKHISAVLGFGGSTLGERREEMIATAVSQMNDCDYWMIHHGEFLRMHAKDDSLVYHLERDWKGADLDAQDRAMLAFVEKLNFTPGKIEQSDVDALRDAGFDDRGVLDVVMQTAMFNFMNRLADGVGIRAEDKFRKLKERKDAEVEAAGQREGAAD